MKKIFIILFLLTNIELFSQSDRQDSVFQTKYQRLNDSLRSDFNNKPKYIYFSTIVLNGKVVKKRADEKFDLLINGKQVPLPKDTTGHYFINFPLDTSQKIVLRYVLNNVVIEQQLSRPSEIENGAYISFGLITNIPRRYKKSQKKKNKDLSIYEMDSNKILSQKTVIKLIELNKLKLIQYVDVTPRIYGCGTSVRYIKFRDK